MTSAGPTPKLQDKAIVFVVDDDISVRESLEMLIQFAAGSRRHSASAEEFLAHPRVLKPNCLVLDVSLPDLNVSIFRRSSPIGSKCRSFL